MQMGRHICICAIFVWHQLLTAMPCSVRFSVVHHVMIAGMMRSPFQLQQSNTSNPTVSALHVAGSPAEQHMHPLLVEDKLAQQLSYMDWMTQLHKTVLAKA